MKDPTRVKESIKYNYLKHKGLYRERAQEGVKALKEPNAFDG